VLRAAPVPMITGAIASGNVRRRAAPIQSDAVTGPASMTGRFAGLPLVRAGVRLALGVFFLRWEDAATQGILLAEPMPDLSETDDQAFGLLSLPSSQSVSDASACAPAVPTCLALICGPLVITCTRAIACP
jgi:hypothetical protein